MPAVARVLTVVNAPGKAPLRPQDAAAVRDALRRDGVSTMPPDWLADGLAFEVGFSGIGREAAEMAARTLLGDQRADVFAQPVAYRRKRLLVADMDSTIIGQECLDELAARAGVGDAVAALTERAMRGEVNFEQALRERVAMLKGKPTSLLERTFSEAVRLNAGARTLVRTMHHHGAHTALVSGGFTFFTSRVAKAAGFGSFGGNEFDIKDGAFTGAIAGPIAGANAKLERLGELTAHFGLRRDETLAIGDGANDIPMLQAAGLGVAYHAKPRVRAAVNARVDLGDLTAALFLQGYRSGDFVTD